MRSEPPTALAQAGSKKKTADGLDVIHHMVKMWGGWISKLFNQRSDNGNHLRL